MSDLICDLASKEDCIIMGRCADAILKNNHIPHISLFITAPFAIRVQHVMDVRKMNEAGSPFPEEDGQPAQTVLQFLRRSSVGQAG